MQIPVTPSVDADKVALVQALRVLRAWEFWGSPDNSNEVQARAISVAMVPIRVEIKEDGRRIPIANLPMVMHEGHFVLSDDGNFRVTARNTSSDTLYFALIYFSLDGSITFMQDSQGRKTDVLAPASTNRASWVSTLYRATLPLGREKLVLFSSDHPLDIEAIENTIGIADVRGSVRSDVAAPWPALHWSFTVTEVEVEAADAAL